MMTAAPCALTIAGSDSGGGAGIQADLKTFHQHGVYGMSAITLLTVQNTRSVQSVQMIEPGMLLDQIDAVVEDIPMHAAKTGALGTAAMIDAVAARAATFDFPLIVDPVMISKHGDSLLDEEARDVMKSSLLPQAFLVTPNLYEAAALIGRAVDSVGAMRDAARAIADLGPHSVLIKGGSLSGDPIDVLLTDGELVELPGERIDTAHTHGTGCAYSAAITARLARGEGMLDAVRAAKTFIAEAIRTAPHLGSGRGPTNLHATAR